MPLKARFSQLASRIGENDRHQITDNVERTRSLLQGRFIGDLGPGYNLFPVRGTARDFEAENFA